MKNKPIRISNEVLKELKKIKSQGRLASYDAVLSKMLKKEGKI